MKDCLATVAAMLPMCTTLARVAAMDAKRLKDIAAVCIDICKDCENECRKHEQHHALAFAQVIANAADKMMAG